MPNCIVLVFYQIKQNPSNTDAKEKLEQIHPVRSDIEMAQEQMEDEDYNGAVETLTRVVEACNFNTHLKIIHRIF